MTFNITSSNKHFNNAADIARTIPAEKATSDAARGKVDEAEFASCCELIAGQKLERVKKKSPESKALSEMLISAGYGKGAVPKLLTNCLFNDKVQDATKSCKTPQDIAVFFSEQEKPIVTKTALYRFAAEEKKTPALDEKAMTAICQKYDLSPDKVADAFRRYALASEQSFQQGMPEATNRVKENISVHKAVAAAVAKSKAVA